MFTAAATTLTLLLAGSTRLALAQSATSGVPDISAIPSACGSSCGSLIETVTLCAQQYPYLTSGNASQQLDLAACVCSGLSSTTGSGGGDLSSCSSCLTSNNDAPAGQAVATLSSTCQAADKACAFECESKKQGQKGGESEGGPCRPHQSGSGDSESAS